MVDAAQAYNEHAGEWSLRLVSGNNNHAHSLLEKLAMAQLLLNLFGTKNLANGCGSGQELALLRYKSAQDADKGSVGRPVRSDTRLLFFPCSLIHARSAACTLTTTPPLFSLIAYWI